MFSILWNVASRMKTGIHKMQHSTLVLPCYHCIRCHSNLELVDHYHRWKTTISRSFPLQSWDLCSKTSHCTSSVLSFFSEFDNYYEGEFVLYRHTSLPYEVCILSLLNNIYTRPSLITLNYNYPDPMSWSLITKDFALECNN